MGNIFVISCKY